jgi:hypothetical protein
MYIYAYVCAAYVTHRGQVQTQGANVTSRAVAGGGCARNTAATSPLRSRSAFGKRGIESKTAREPNTT